MIQRLQFLMLALTPVLALSFQAAAQNTDATDGYKIGIVDRKEVFDNYERKKEAFKSIEADVAQVQADIDEATQRILAKKESFDAQKDSMSQEELLQMEREIRRDVEEQQLKLKRHQEEIDTRQALLIKELKDEINATIAEVGVEKNYHIIFEGDKRSKTSVIYYSSRMDITSEIITRLNGK